MNHREEDLKKIIDHYGLEHQVLKLAEEAVELADACFKFLKGYPDYGVLILDELADVHVVGDQLRIVQGDTQRDPAYFDTLMDMKIDRTLRRINEAEVGRAE